MKRICVILLISLLWGFLLYPAANEVEIGKQFARSELTKNLCKEREYLGIIRRGEHVTVLFKQKNEKKEGEWLGRLVLGFEQDEIKIFGATLF